MLAISTDDLAGAESLARRVGVEFPVLYTSGDSAVPMAYDVFNLHGDGLAAPAVFIVDQDGAIAYEYIGTNYRQRVSADTVIRNLP